MPNTVRLRALAKHLRTGRLGHKEFDFGCFNNVVAGGVNAGPPANTCGTNGCAIGECPIVFPADWKFDQYGSPTLAGAGPTALPTPFRAAADFFEISILQVQHLFDPCRQLPLHYGGRRLNFYATKEDVAENIESFCDLADAGKIT